jgi:phosphotransferase system enzyme I (PtsP)
MQQARSALVLRRLLARIRDVMAGEGDAEARLARIVQVIAVDLSSQVCSIYVRRAGDVLELFATEGLKPAAVHRTRLRFGEGLIGEIAARARPIALADAQSHPSFVYRPETGEEIYRSLMGVPVLRGGRVVGVLAIQNVSRRHYTDEEIEALQTVSMVLAELVASGHLIGADELVATEGIALVPMRLEGARLNGGVGLGQAVLHSQRFPVHRLVAEDTRHEHERLRSAVADMHGALDDMLRSSTVAGPGEHRDILETYRMIAEDAGWLRRISEAINSGLTAEAAVQKVNDEIHVRMNEVSDAYLRERVHDLEDLASRLMQHLLGVTDTLPPLPADVDFALVARNLGPAQLLNYHSSRLRAVVLEEGSPNAHVAIVARALDIPVIGQVREATRRIENGDFVIVDADHSQVLVRPSEDIRQQFVRSLATIRERKAKFAALRDLPPMTRDGTRLSLCINAGLLVDMQHFGDMGADGVGLYRTEVPFMVRSVLPNVASQCQLYQKVLDYAGDKPVIFRTLDIGGDKVMPFWGRGQDENPAMGWRAIRVSQDRPAILQQQVRALIEAAARRDLNVMFPMISEVSEFRFGRRIIERELTRLQRKGGTLPRSIRVGAMVEVPALIYQLDELLPDVDFLSIGTNDLFQFLFATDRGSYEMSERYDALSPVALRLLQDVLKRATVAERPVSLCGEMASRPLDALALIGIGFRTLSLSPPAVGPIKEMVRSIRMPSVSEFVQSLLSGKQRSIRPHLRAFALDHGISI